MRAIRGPAWGGAGGPARHDTDEAEGFICDTILIFDADGRCCHGGPHGHGYGNAQCSTKAVFRRQGVGHCSNVSPLQVCFLAQRLPGGERGDRDTAWAGATGATWTPLQGTHSRVLLNKPS